jgi:hypothetical protein
MARVIAHAGEALDHRSDPGQRPQVCAEPVRARPLAQGRVDARQLLVIQPWSAAQPSRRLQARPALLLPRLVPAVRGLTTDPQLGHDHRLRGSAGKQARRLESARLQRGHIPSLWLGHASTWHRSP